MCIRGWLRQVFFLAGAALAVDRIHAAEPASAPGRVTQADRRFWSFQTLRPVVPPSVRNTDKLRTPVDAFVLAKLEAQGRTFAPEADPICLIRRASLDLLGIPPAPEEIDAFLADRAPGAFERLVDRLLASPRFGERWGRHWLDVVGFVDTVGFDVDADLIITSEGKWRYRDYVIRSFNRDTPYDRFLVEQLAGDELIDWRDAPRFTPEIRELLIATGYLRTAQDFTHEDVGNIPQNHFGVLHDTIEIVGSSLLGLTLNCARCHSHKFDPVPQEDYYRLMSVFTPAYNPNQWKIVFPYDPKLEDRSIPDVSATERAEIERHNARIDERKTDVNRRIDEIRRPYRDRLFAAKLAGLPESIRADVKTALATPAKQRNEIQKYLAGKFEGPLKLGADEIAAVVNSADKDTIERLKAEVAALDAQRRRFGKIQALYDVGPPPPTHRLVRGNHETPGPEVGPGVLRVLCDDGSTGLLAPKPPNPHTSGRRLALARWLTAPDTPASSLVARVMVNRAWLALFGRGIVPTPENFGRGGEPPTHPEMLEWLSREFVQRGWRLKPLIRLIMTSAVYRQASKSVAATDDRDDRLLGRQRLKRLESEALRDAILTVSGALDPAMGGPPVMLEARPDGMVVVAESKLPTPTAKWRRSVYLLIRRAFHLSLLTVFDQPVVATNCPERSRSAVPLQSLTMLNDAFLLEQSERFADRVSRRSGPSAEERIISAFRLALGRTPSKDEIRWCEELLAREAALYRKDKVPAEASERKALAHLCHTLLNTSEFLYAP